MIRNLYFLGPIYIYIGPLCGIYGINTQKRNTICIHLSMLSFVFNYLQIDVLLLCSMNLEGSPAKKRKGRQGSRKRRNQCLPVLASKLKKPCLLFSTGKSKAVF